MPHFAFAALGRDRRGIVEGVTRVLLEHGVNVEDSQMAILRGRFSMTLILEAGAGADVARLDGDLSGIARELGLEALTLDPLEELEGGSTQPTHIVTVYGADHPGIVHAAAAALTDAGCNITDLNTRVADARADSAEPLYVLMLEAVVPVGLLERLEAELQRVAREQDVEVNVRELESDEL